MSRSRSSNVGVAALLALIALVVGIVSAPAGAQDTTTSEGESQVLRIGWAQDPQTLNPFVGLDEEDYTVWALTWDLLVNFDPEDLSPTAGIAESWEVSEDGKTVTFTLDRGSQVVRRRADHLRRRQVLARDARRARARCSPATRTTSPRSRRPTSRPS